jgi:diguanylate cyclase (GGDEF)-like protein
MSAQVALRRQVTHLTFNDGLTGLPNRAYAEQRGQHVLSQPISAAGAPDGPGTVAGVMILDLDGFTAINEGRGSTAADLLLAQVARRLRLAVSPQDTVARWGGDEFAVLTESAESTEELAEIAERLSRSVASLPFRIGEEDLAITASVGVALADGSPAAHVWRNAEMALARAKGSGTGEVEVFGLGTGEAGADEIGAAATGPGEPEPGRASGRGASAGPLAADEPGMSEPGMSEPRMDEAGADEPGPMVSAVGEAAETPAGAGT